MTRKEIHFSVDYSFGSSEGLTNTRLHRLMLDVKPNNVLNAGLREQKRLHMSPQTVSSKYFFNQKESERELCVRASTVNEKTRFISYIV